MKAGLIGREENNEDIYTHVHATGVEMKAVNKLDFEPDKAAIEEIDGEEVVPYEADVSPFVVARDEEGFAAIGKKIQDSSWHNNTSDEGYSSMGKGPTNVWMNYEKPEKLSIAIDYSDGSEPQPLFRGAIEKIDDRLEEYTDFSDGIEYKGDAIGQFQLEVDMSGEPDQAVERVETAYTAVRAALEESLSYEI